MYRMNKGVMTQGQAALNAIMVSFRVVVEWGFGNLSSNWRYSGNNEVNKVSDPLLL